MFDERDLVAFANYCLSDYRRSLIASHPELDNHEDRVKEVSDADFQNWLESQGE